MSIEAIFAAIFIDYIVDIYILFIVAYIRDIKILSQDKCGVEIIYYSCGSVLQKSFTGNHFPHFSFLSNLFIQFYL